MNLWLKVGLIVGAVLFAFVWALCVVMARSDAAGDWENEAWFRAKGERDGE